MTWMRIVLPHACYAVQVDAHGIIVAAPPIARWALGRPWTVLQRHVARQGGTWEAV